MQRPVDQQTIAGFAGLPPHPSSQAIARPQVQGLQQHPRSQFGSQYSSQDPPILGMTDQQMQAHQQAYLEIENCHEREDRQSGGNAHRYAGMVTSERLGHDAYQQGQSTTFAQQEMFAKPEEMTHNQLLVHQAGEAGKPWTGVERKLLKKLSANKDDRGKPLSDVKIAEFFPKRSLPAIKTQNVKRRREAGTTRKHWTPEDEKIALNLGKNEIPYAEISKHISQSRSKRAIYQKLKELNASKKYKDPEKEMDDEEPEEPEPSSRQYLKPAQKEERPQQQLSMSEQSGHTTHTPQRREQAQASSSGTKRKQDSRKGSISETSALQGFNNNPQKKTKKINR